MGKAANTYFTQSGCLTLEGLERYSSGDLQEKDRLKIKSHLETCEMCSDALEGIGLLADKEDLENTIAEINQGLMGKLPKEKQESRTLKPTGKLFYYSAAASILILFGILSYLNFPAHERTMETAGNIIKENMELPALPVPPLGKGKKTDRAREAKKQKPIQSTGEKLQHITVNFSEIGDEAFFDEDIEISLVESEKQSKGEKEINGTNSPEGFLMDMVMISGSSTKSGPSAPVQFLQYDEEADSGEKGNGKDEEAVFTIVETMPRFPGGETGLRKYLQQNLSYPAKARKAGIEGKIYVSFVVNSAGKATDVKIVKGIGEACDEQALRAINNMPFWKPATQQGRPVSVRFVVPVYFKLN